MTAGVPGTGIGGLFYILSAVLLPIRAIWKILGGARLSLRSVIKPTAIAVGVLAGIWATGWLLGLLFEPTVITVKKISDATMSVRVKYENIVRWAALVAGFATLGAVLLSVQVARLLVRQKKIR
jgi:hypothetical protein